MTRLIISFLLLTALSVSLTSAQEKISFGVKAGLNLNNTAYSRPFEYQNSDNQVSYHLGIYSKIKIVGKFNFMPELQFIKKGYSIDGENALRLSYIELPLMISYAPLKFLSIEAGPTVGIQLLATTKKAAMLDEAYHESFEFGATGGLRFRLTEKFSLTGRYYRGFTNISQLLVFENGINEEDIKEFNYNFQISAYYRLFL